VYSGASEPGPSPGNSDELELLTKIIARHRGKRESAIVSRALIDRFGRIGNVLRARPSELARIRGYGPDIGSELRDTGRLLFALARRELGQRPLLDQPKSVMRYCRVLLGGERRERLHVLFLDKSLKLICERCLQVGTIDHVTVYPREIIQSALDQSAFGLILAHNHPSGNPHPSAADIDMTERIRRAASLFDLRLVDHIIVGAASEFSFRANGLLGMNPVPKLRRAAKTADRHDV
jgi:DNA repair protein RadC